ncbi:MAG TPA: SDR family oxidoreductase [Candidatus Binatia bacterium]|nr:SDR family oxidoreductase [Candidatus Binatia bacterium]
MSSPRKAILVTGAAAGIGRATARLFASRGWFVGLYDVNAAGAEALRGELGSAAVAGALDVTDAAAWSRVLAAFAAASGGRLDVLFNCAGIAAVGHFEDIPLARHHAVTDVNFKGVVNGCHLALPLLRATPGARVINMASASAIYGSPAFAGYCATKFAVRGLTEALNIEWARHGIRVMDLLPLFVDTPMVRQFETPPRSMDVLGLRLTADDVARTVWRAAHWRLWPRVHWFVGVQAWLTWVAQKLTPVWFTRLTTRLITGY